MIKLDEYESQMIWLSKGWVRKNWVDKEYFLETVLKNLWSNRCGIEVKHVNYRNIANFLINLLDKVLLKYDKIEFFQRLAPTDFLWKVYNDNRGYYLRICQIVLFNYLANLQIKDGEKTLVELQKLNMSLFENEEK